MAPNIKNRLYNLLPKLMQKRAKNIYYDYLIFNLYRLKYRLFYGFWDFFDAIALETTTHCNLRCKNCPNSIYGRGLLKNKKLMEEPLFKKIINELAEIKYRGAVLFHFYGEPLTDKRLPELVLYARKKLPKSKLKINTNGVLLDYEIYQKLIDSGVDSFFITQYTEIMPQNLRIFFDSLKTKSLKEKKIEYRVLGKDLGLSNRGGEIKVDKTVDYDRPICIYPNTAIHVDYSGNIVLCCNDYHSSVTFGNLKKKRLLEIWNNPFYTNLRRDLRKKQFNLPICKKCVGLE